MVLVLSVQGQFGFNEPRQDTGEVEVEQGQGVGRGVEGAVLESNVMIGHGYVSIG